MKTPTGKSNTNRKRIASELPNKSKNHNNIGTVNSKVVFLLIQIVGLFSFHISYGVDLRHLQT